MTVKQKMRGLVDRLTLAFDLVKRCGTTTTLLKESAMRPWRTFVGLLSCGICVTAVFLGKGAMPADDSRRNVDPVAPQAASAMVPAAQKLLAGLSDDVRAKASFALDDPYRTQWHYYPITPEPRKGAVLKAMT